MNHQFVWLELRADDLPKAKKFYSEMFGWKLEDMPMGDKGVYVMVKGAGAAKELGAGMVVNPAKGHMVSHWTPFVGVQDINAATKKAEKLGAEVVQQVMETPWGLVSTILDTSGAALSLWQAKPEK